MRIAIAFLTALAASVVLGPAVAQQGQCGPTADVTRVLSEQFGERAMVRGTTQTGSHVFELYVNPQTRTWTLLFHQAQTGVTCMATDGTDFEPSPEAEPKPNQGSSL